VAERSRGRFLITGKEAEIQIKKNAPWNLIQEASLNRIST
jgi:hypothetical protein